MLRSFAPVKGLGLRDSKKGHTLKKLVGHFYIANLGIRPLSREHHVRMSIFEIIFLVRGEPHDPCRSGIGALGTQVWSGGSGVWSIHLFQGAQLVQGAQPPPPWPTVL